MACGDLESRNYTADLNIGVAEKRVLESYDGYMEVLSEEGVPLPRFGRKMELHLNNSFTKHVSEDANLRYLPATLWQVYALTGVNDWKQMAENYTEVLSTSIFPHRQIDGELIQNSLMTPFEITGDSKYYSLILESLSTYLSFEEQKDENFYYSDLEKLLENPLLFFASERTGDPVYKDLAIQQSDKIFTEHFQSDASKELYFGIVNWEKLPGISELESLESEDFYFLALCMYGFTILYNERGSDKYYESVVRLAEIFSTVFEEGESSGSPSADDELMKKQIRNKVDLISRVMICLAYSNLAEGQTLMQKEICESIFMSVLDMLDAKPNSNDKQYSFRLYYYLMEYLKHIQHNA